jgi:hypothetical protein
MGSTRSLRVEATDGEVAPKLAQWTHGVHTGRSVQIGVGAPSEYFWLAWLQIHVAQRFLCSSPSTQDGSSHRNLLRSRLFAKQAKSNRPALSSGWIISIC